MSGGSLNYLYRMLEDAEFELDTPERRAFAKHLEKVAKALHDIEWVDSGDYSPGQESASIRKCLAKGDVVETLIKEGRDLILNLNKEVQE